MKNGRKRREAPAIALLQSILDRAVECGADTVELERVPEGLEIMYLAGHTGVGDVLHDSKMEGALIDLIVDRAGLEDEVAGTLTWPVRGQTRDIEVEVYDSFGEACFRLKLGRAKPKKRPR